MFTGLHIKEVFIEPLTVSRFGGLSELSLRFCCNGDTTGLRIFIDQKVIFTAQVFQVAQESVVLNKQLFAECQIPAIVTVCLFPLGTTKTVKGRLQAFEPPEMSLPVCGIIGISQHHVRAVVAVGSYCLQPFICSRFTFNVSDDNPLILSGFDANRKSYFRSAQVMT